jgi:acyl-CoA-dependent ceramide synthase
MTVNSRRRGSSVGAIDVGDTAALLSTMPKTKSMKRNSKSRILQLSESSDSDSALLKKIWIAYRELSYRQTWINPSILIIGIVLTYVLSESSSKMHQTIATWIFPSYQLPDGQYGKGVNDFYFVGFYALIFTFLREFIMCMVLHPAAGYFGIKKEAKVRRFMEQTYSMIYYGSSGPFGLWIMSKLPLWYFDTTQFYVDFPHKTHDFYFKVYYLGQAAFWVQQSVVLVLQLEKPRKDFKELVLHHVITIALIWNSYRFHFTWMGLAIYITMDVSDFFLATSKTLNYLDSKLTPYFFGTFVFVWIYLRHYLNLKILWSVLTEFKTVGDYTLNWDTQQYKCYISQPIVFFLIGALQLVNVYWLVLIIRILWRYVVGGVAADERSDDESEESEEDDKKNQ